MLPSSLQSTHYWHQGPSSSFPIQHVLLSCTLQQTPQANILRNCFHIGWPTCKPHHLMKQKSLAPKHMTTLINIQFTRMMMLLPQMPTIHQMRSKIMPLSWDRLLPALVAALLTPALVQMVVPPQVHSCPSPVQQAAASLPRELTFCHGAPEFHYNHAMEILLTTMLMPGGHMCQQG